jgi:hypothetical protein
MPVSFVSTETQAYVAGFKAGQADRAINWKSRYVWHSRPHEGVYLWHYSLGYKTGWNREQF